MWKRVLESFEFPLLRRELIQSAGRRRTWVLRGVVSLVLVSVMLSWYGGVLQRSSLMGAGNLSFLGAGTQLLAGVVMFDLWAMLLLLPALTCSAISAERERQTLGLVLVSRMTPAGIVFEKFLARLIPMAWLLLLTGPLLGVTYSMGGFSQGAISVALTVLLLAALQISSVAMFWSSLLGSSQGAFWMTYMSLIALAAGPPFLIYVCGLRVFFPAGADYFSSLFTSYLLSAVMFQFGGSVWSVLSAGLPVVVTAGVLILISGLAVSRCREEAPLTGKRVIRGVAWVLAWLLTRPEWLLRRIGLLSPAGSGAGVAAAAVFEESRMLPATGVIAWREISLSILARRSGQILVSVMLVVLVLWLSLDEGLQIRQPGPVIIAYFLLVLIGVMAVLSTAARSVVSEREKQTLEILLTTPISNRQFLLEKSAGAMRICVFVLVACGVLQACRVLLDDRLQPWLRNSDNALAFWVRSMVFTFLHLLFCLWVGVLCSLRASSQMKAAAWSLFVILIFALAPVFVYGFFSLFWLSANDVLVLLTVYPVGMWICCEARDFPGRDVELQFACILLSLFFYGLLVCGVRYWAMRSAGEYLQRECEE